MLSLLSAGRNPTYVGALVGRAGGPLRTRALPRLSCGLLRRAGVFTLSPHSRP